MNVNHTPLPWTIEVWDPEKHEQQFGVYVILQAQTTPFTRWEAARAQNQANAELLQAAVNVNNHAALVAALEEAVAACPNCFDWNCTKHPRVLEARAALEKAKEK